MALIDEVQQLCERLAPAGWSDLLRLHGLDIEARPLAQALSMPLAIDRNVKGFEDFSLLGGRAIEPGNPARSLLYHAMASPNVTEGVEGAPLSGFPTPAELETLLNYVYGVNPPSLAQLQAQVGQDAVLAVVVFAVEYRPRSETPHRKHADQCFSRTGIARVGTAPAHYEPRLRGFSPFVDQQPQAMRVMPARYSAYIAVQQKGGTGDGWLDGDQALDFWRPLHKLFSGPECLAERALQVDLKAYHVNEKLRQFHLKYPQQWTEPALSQPPFVLTEGLAQWGEHTLYGQGLCMPQSKPCLVEYAQLNNQHVSFRVPPGADFGGYIINKRYRVLLDGSIADLNNEPEVDAIVNAGNYEAAHFIDFTAEGWIKAECPEVSALIPLNIAAYSILSAPDFYPTCGQAELVQWAQEQDLPEGTWYVTLMALSQRRVAANPALPESGFVLEDKSMTVLVSAFSQQEEPPTVGPSARAERQSWLPDTAAGTFSPGWEIASDGQGFIPKFLCSFNLGSPFTEDVRICSAAGGYWPAVTPDSARTFEPYVSKPTVIPLTDEEIGLSNQGSWDGETGPRLIEIEGRPWVEYTAYEYSDYTKNALAGLLSLRPTGQTTFAQYTQRVLAMQSVYLSLGAVNPAERGQWSVLSFSSVSPSDSAQYEALSAAQRQASTVLEGDVFRFKVYQHGHVVKPADFTRLQVEVLEMVEAFSNGKRVLIKREHQDWQASSLG